MDTPHAIAKRTLLDLLKDSEHGIIKRKDARAILHMIGIRKEYVLTNAIRDLDLVSANGELWARDEFDKSFDLPMARGPQPGQRQAMVQAWVREQLPCTMTELYERGAPLGYGYMSLDKAIKAINPLIVANDW